MLTICNLYHCGDRDLLGEQYKRVAVVGSRRMTEYGRMVIQKIIPGLVKVGVVIVSGFMYGVDQEAHKVCLENDGKTIAVLGWGINWAVPEDDQVLFGRIKDKGLIVSEYEAKRAPALWMFPQRNRIVAGISDAVLVVEAAEKSGSLITARLAIEQGKKLFCVPGPINSRVSVGTNELIKNGKAMMVTEAGDVLKELGIDNSFVFPLRKEEGGISSPLTKGRGKEGSLEKAILSALENEGLLMDEISQKIREPITMISPVVSVLELGGVIKNVNGRYYLT